jgi:hypothetical protein
MDSSTTNSSLEYQRLHWPPAHHENRASDARRRAPSHELKSHAAEPAQPRASLPAMLNGLTGALSSLRVRTGRGPGSPSPANDAPAVAVAVPEARRLTARLSVPQDIAAASPPHARSSPPKLVPLSNDQPVVIIDAEGNQVVLGGRMLRVQSDGGTLYDLDLATTTVFRRGSDAGTR